MKKKSLVLSAALLLFCPGALAAPTLKPGDPAPDFSARNQAGKLVQLSALRGKFVLLYFYPKDDTPGCTKEACSFRDHFSEIEKMNTVVLGVSRQSEASHQKFIAHHKLPFDLLVDQEGSIAKSFGVGTMPLIGFLQRKSVLIGPDGKVLRFYDHVDPAKHAEQVLSDLKAVGAR